MISLALGIVCLILIGLLLVQRSRLRYTSELLNDTHRQTEKILQRMLKDSKGLEQLYYDVSSRASRTWLKYQDTVIERDRLRKELAELKGGISCTELD